MPFRYHVIKYFIKIFISDCIALDYATPIWIYNFVVLRNNIGFWRVSVIYGHLLCITWPTLMTTASLLPRSPFVCVWQFRSQVTPMSVQCCSLTTRHQMADWSLTPYQKAIKHITWFVLPLLDGYLDLLGLVLNYSLRAFFCSSQQFHI